MKKEKKYLVLGIAFSLLVLMGVTYAYFTTRIIGDKKNVTIDMAELKVIFTNGDAIEASEVYAEDNLDIIKSFSVENKTKNEYKYNIVIEDLVNTFVTEGYLVYKITSTDGGYNMTEFEDVPKGNNFNAGLAYNISIPAKSIQNYNIEIKYIYSETEDQSKDQGAKISGKLYIEGYYRNKSLRTVMLEDNPTRSKRTDFSESLNPVTTGTLYNTTEGIGNSTKYVHYYAGNTTNNWVKFGKDKKVSCTYNGVEVDYFNSSIGGLQIIENESDCTSSFVCDLGGEYIIGYTEELCKKYYTWIEEKATYNGLVESDIYWRIIRTNYDNSVRLLYAGNKPDSEYGYIGYSDFNENEGENDPMYSGYMYGTSGSLENNRLNINDSVIKTYIDNWYETNLLSDYDKYISKTAIYCNDRSVGEGTYSTSENAFYYGGWTRLWKNRIPSPSYTCGANASGGLFESTQAIEDMFSASTEGGGNGQLKYPVALMTADEILFGDGNYSNGDNYYTLNSNNYGSTRFKFWTTMTPAGFYSTKRLYIFMQAYQPAFALDIYDSYGFGNHVIRPVLSLDECVIIKSGDGTPDNPYVVDYENSCK